MEVPVALALPNGLAVTEIEMIDEVLTLTAVSVQMRACWEWRFQSMHCSKFQSPARDFSRFNDEQSRSLSNLDASFQSPAGNDPQ
jgi:hypothetical protein